jgi:hypothetical protein
MRKRKEETVEKSGVAHNKRPQKEINVIWMRVWSWISVGGSEEGTYCSIIFPPVAF